MKLIEAFQDFSYNKELVLQHKNRRDITITIVVDSNYIVTDIIYSPKQTERMFRLPYKIGKRANLRFVEDWACKNDFLLNGRDTCPEKKVFGIKTSDIPQGHPLRYAYPNKFR